MYRLLNCKHIEIHCIINNIMLQYMLQMHCIVNNSINSLHPSHAIWQLRYLSTMVWIMACYLTAPSHCLNQCWIHIIGSYPSAISKKMGKACWLKLSYRVNVFEDFHTSARRQCVRWPVSYIVPRDHFTSVSNFAINISAFMSGIGYVSRWRANYQWRTFPTRRNGPVRLA